MKVLVCGGRHYDNYGFLSEVLDEIHAATPIELIIEGGQFGAEFLASSWARGHRVPYRSVTPEWARHGKAAGPIRNGEMLDLAPDLVVAFPGGRGTADMVRQARGRGVSVKLAGAHT